MNIRKGREWGRCPGEEPAWPRPVGISLGDRNLPAGLAWLLPTYRPARRHRGSGCGAERLGVNSFGAFFE